MDSYKYHRPTRRPRLSHRSLGRQPNDQLGRSCFRPNLFEHWRQILRGSTGSDTDANSNPNSDCNSDGNCNSYVDTFPASETYTNSAASAHFSAAPLKTNGRSGSLAAVQKTAERAIRFPLR